MWLLVDLTEFCTEPRIFWTVCTSNVNVCRVKNPLIPHQCKSSFESIARLFPDQLNINRRHRFGSLRTVTAPAVCRNRFPRDVSKHTCTVKRDSPNPQTHETEVVLYPNTHHVTSSSHSRVPQRLLCSFHGAISLHTLPAPNWKGIPRDHSVLSGRSFLFRRDLSSRVRRWSYVSDDDVLLRYISEGVSLFCSHLTTVCFFLENVRPLTSKCDL